MMTCSHVNVVQHLAGKACCQNADVVNDACKGPFGLRIDRKAGVNPAARMAKPYQCW